MAFFKTLIPAFLVVIFFCISCTSGLNEVSRVVGVKIYRWDGEMEDLFSTWEEIGINTVFASSELLSDTKFREGLRSRGMRSFLIFPVFFDTEALQTDPGLSLDQLGAGGRGDLLHQLP